MANEPHLLLIESGPASTVRGTLERAGFRVTATGEGVRAIGIASACGDVAAVVLDGVQGLHLITYLRHRFPDTPLLSVGASLHSALATADPFGG